MTTDTSFRDAVRLRKLTFRRAYIKEKRLDGRKNKCGDAIFRRDTTKRRRKMFFYDAFVDDCRHIKRNEQERK